MRLPGDELGPCPCGHRQAMCHRVNAAKWCPPVEAIPAVDAQPLVEFAQWLVTGAALPLIRKTLSLDEIEKRARAALDEYGRAGLPREDE